MTHNMAFVAGLLINETTEQTNIMKEITGTDTYKKKSKSLQDETAELLEYNLSL